MSLRLPDYPGKAATVSDVRILDGETVHGGVSILVTDQAFGKLTGVMDFDEEAIQKIYPEFTVAREMVEDESSEYSVITVSHGDPPLFTLEPDIHYERIASVASWSPSIQLGNVQHLGQKFASIYEIEKPKWLSAYVNMLDGTIKTLALGGTRIIYTFQIPEGYEGPNDGSRPSLEQLGAWPLESVQWLP